MAYLLDLNGDYALAPHNYHQDITLISLVGGVANVTFDAGRKPERACKTLHAEWEFRSGILVQTSNSTPLRWSGQPGM